MSTSNKSCHQAWILALISDIFVNILLVTAIIIMLFCLGQRRSHKSLHDIQFAVVVCFFFTFLSTYIPFRALNPLHSGRLPTKFSFFFVFDLPALQWMHASTWMHEGHCNVVLYTAPQKKQITNLSLRYNLHPDQWQRVSCLVANCDPFTKPASSLMSGVHEGSSCALNVYVNIWWTFHYRWVTLTMLYMHQSLSGQGASWLRTLAGSKEHW